MRSKFYLLFVLIPLFTYADQQYSETHCNELKKEKERIQERFTKGYGVAEGNYLNDRDRELFQIMRKYCVAPIKPNDGVDYKQGETDSIPEISYDSSSINDNWSAQNRTYEGEKLKAWAAFYKMPAKCRQKNSANHDFVACADDKAKQKIQFESYWRNNIKIN
ncbi:hypothetical protein MN202_11085 [Rheinheimera muenzenbergensis]|uniref:Uncharacterized protein n=1 Tax=Rheinheimera muenzenbergensis TaxID=1193628 RepID=A0ABU8C8C7_9GAMM